MSLIKNFVKEVKNHEIILGVLMLLYLFSGVETPHEIAPYIDNVFGYGILMVLTILIFVGTNPVLGILTAICFIVLVNRSNASHPVNVMPSDNYKNTVMNSLNAGNESIVSEQLAVLGGNSKSLEEEVVEKVVMVSSSENSLDTASYNYVLSDNHGALELAS